CVHAGRTRAARLHAGARRARGWRRRRRDRLQLRGRRRSGAMDRLPQLLRDHALQPLADVRDGRPPAPARHPRRRGRRRKQRRQMKRLAAAATCRLLAACAGNPPKPRPPLVAVPDPVPDNGAPRRSPYAPAQEDLSKRGNYTAGGLYAPGVADSAPDGGIPDVHLIPEPEVVAEPHSRYGNRSPYTVLGKKYYVRDSAEGYRETGIASYYGRKFHGRRTSNLEVYDMYAFTAAHKTLPLPSFARVTNLANGSSVVVRVNDRGPFHDGRIIDLSYAAAVKLGVDRAGTARVEVVG